MSNRKKLTDEQKRQYNAKRRQTLLERYGNPNYVNSEKCKQTKLERYGDANYNNKEKTRQTCLNKYGVSHQSKVKEIAEKIRQSKLTRETQEKYEKTMIDRYGVSHPNNCPTMREKYTQTLIKNYGVTNPLKCKAIYDKHIETMFKNNSFNNSKEEELLFKQLVDQYGEDNVLRQYSEERYPFKCDFYIKSEDLFIELNLHPTHGTHPFNPNDYEDIVLLEKLRRDDTEWSNKIIDVWSVRDYNKRQCAIKNNLNYKVIYSIKEL